MRRTLWALASTGLAGLACGETTGPVAALCATRHGAEACADRAEYGPGDFVRVRVRNASAATLYLDGCATKIVGKTSRSVPFEAVYDPSLRCGQNATQADIVAAMSELAPGETRQETLQLAPFAFQGFYRVNLWILDAAGALIAPDPAVTGTFRVSPSAS